MFEALHRGLSGTLDLALLDALGAGWAELPPASNQQGDWLGRSMKVALSQSVLSLPAEAECRTMEENDDEAAAAAGRRGRWYWDRLQPQWGTVDAEGEGGVERYAALIVHVALHCRDVEEEAAARQSISLLGAMHGWLWCYELWIAPTLWPLLFEPGNYSAGFPLDGAMDADTTVRVDDASEEIESARQLRAIRLLGDLGQQVAEAAAGDSGGGADQGALKVTAALTQGLAKRLAVESGTGTPLAVMTLEAMAKLGVA